jgi:hypothetical protein
LHRLLGTLVSQRLPKKLLPEPDLSQKMSGLLRPKWLPITELLVGFDPMLSYGSVETTTPPETGVGPEGTLTERWLTRWRRKRQAAEPFFRIVELRENLLLYVKSDSLIEPMSSIAQWLMDDTTFDTTQSATRRNSRQPRVKNLV